MYVRGDGWGGRAGIDVRFERHTRHDRNVVEAVAKHLKTELPSNPYSTWTSSKATNSMQKRRERRNMNMSGVRTKPLERIAQYRRCHLEQRGVV